jgi:DNA-directed RNA polymerase beta' subunit
MNMHAPQSMQATLELRDITAVNHQLISPANSKPIISITQDSLIGGYLMTKKTTFFTRKEVFDLMMGIKSFQNKFPEPVKTVNNIDYWSGIQIFSMILPEISLESKNKYDEKISVVNGNLLNGPIDKGLLGGSPNGFIRQIHALYGSTRAAQFINEAQLITNEYLKKHSFSIGYGDCLTPKELQADIDKCLDDASNKVNELIQKANHGVYNRELPDELIIPALEQDIIGITKSQSDEKILKLLKAYYNEKEPNNGIYLSVMTGVKGEPTNIRQIIGSFGTNLDTGHRIDFGFDQRALPHFHKNHYEAEGRGFTRSPFIKGIKPVDYFEHALTGRNGVIDTAIKTASSGYLERRLIKAMEDVVVRYDNTVRNASENIVQFVYGDDYFDPVKLISQPVKLVERNNAELWKTYAFEPDFDWALYLRPEQASEAAEMNVEELSSEYENMMEIRDEIRINYNEMRAITDINIFLPFNLFQLIHNAKRKFNIESGTLSNISPQYIRTEIDNLIEKIMDLVLEKNSLYMLKSAIRFYLASKECIVTHHLTREVFDYLTNLVYDQTVTSFITPGSLVGIEGAQSIGEPSTQMTLNSVSKKILVGFQSQNEFEIFKIGNYIDDLLENANPNDIKHIPKNRTQYLELTEDVYISSCDNLGNVDWHKVTAVTKHLPVGDLIEIKTRSGRYTTITQAKSVIVWNGEEFVEKNGSELKIDDLLPTTINFPEPMEEVNQLNLKKYLPTNEWLYGTYFYRLENLFNADTRTRKIGFWDKHSDLVAKLPYNRSDSIIDAFRSLKKYDICPGYVYPKKCQTGVHEIPDMIDLDEKFGFIVGLYLAEGWVTNTFMAISNNDGTIMDKVTDWCDELGVTYHIVETESKRFENALTTDIKIHSVTLARLFKKWLGTGSANKVVPTEAYLSNKEFVKGILDGYISGDGTVNKRDGYIVASSASEELLIGISNLCTRFGIFGKLSMHIVKKNNVGSKNIKDVHTFSIRNKFAKKFATQIGFTHPDKQETAEESILNREYLCPNGRYYEQQEDVILDPVVSIEIVPDTSSEYVYDLTVPETLNFSTYSGLQLRDTFHLAGVGEKQIVTTMGVPRLEEIIKLSKAESIKTPSMKIYLSEEYELDKEKIRTIKGLFEYTKLSDIVSKTEIIYDNDEEEIYEEDMEFIRAYHEISELFDLNVTHQESMSPWILRITFHKETMMNKNILMSDVQEAVMMKNKSGYDNVQCIFTDDNAGNLIMRINVRRDDSIDDEEENVEDELYFMRTFEEQLMNITIRGFDNIKQVEMAHEKKMFYYEDGTYEDKDIWFLQTIGTNMPDVLTNDMVDPTRIVSNDIRGMFEMFDIEVAREVIISELNTIMDEYDTNYRHLALLVDVMTYKGSLMSIMRNSMNRMNDASVMGKASFEEIPKIITQAAVFSEKDNMKGVSANVAVGQPCDRVGTNAFQLIVDEQMMSEMVDEDDEMDVTEELEGDRFMKMTDDELVEFVSEELGKELNPETNVTDSDFMFPVNIENMSQFDINNNKIYDGIINIVNGSKQNLEPVLEEKEDTEEDAEEDDNTDDEGASESKGSEPEAEPMSESDKEEEEEPEPKPEPKKVIKKKFKIVRKKKA